MPAVAGPICWRFAIRIPRQATACRHGDTGPQDLCAPSEIAMGDDFVRALGRLPPDMPKKAVLDKFVAASD